MSVGPGRLIAITHGVCAACGALVPARVEARGDEVWLGRLCATHGRDDALVWRGVASYVETLRCVKPAWIPREHDGDSGAPCPDGCGLCSRHEQHLCMPIVEITGRCDLSCPICLVDAGAGEDLSGDGFDRILDGLVRSERQVDVLNLSGGEPLVHPRFLDLVDRALARPEIVRVSVSTNGLGLLRRPELADELRSRDVVVALQLDAIDDEEVFRTLRGAALADAKRGVLDLLATADVSTSLVMTLAGGVNEHQLRPLLDVLFDRPHVISLMVQPLAFAGRAATAPLAATRLTLPDVVRLLGEAGHPALGADDLMPLPCSHAHCFALGFFLAVAGGGAVSVRRLADEDTVLDALANRGLFGLDRSEHQRIKDLVYELWSGPTAAAPDRVAVTATLRELLLELGRTGEASGFDPRAAFRTTERRLKSVFVHAFQDAGSFDLARIRRCCNGYPQPDGRIVPACRHNVLGRVRRDD